MTDLFETIRQAEYIEDIKKDPRIISTVDNPIELLQLTAIEHSYSVSILVGIPVLTYNAQLAAVKKWGDALRYIENPSRDIVFNAVKSSAQAIRYIVRPSRRFQLIAVKQNPDIIQYIDYPCIDAELLAWELAKKTTRNPCKEVQLLLRAHKLKQLEELREKHARKILQDTAHKVEKKEQSKKWRNFKLNKG